MHTSPISTLPGQIIGYVNGKPVRTIAGGSAPLATDPAPVTDPAPEAPPATDPAPPADPFTAWDGKVESLPPAAQKIISDARREAADNRVAKNAETDKVKAILAAAGLDIGQEDPVEALKTSRSDNQNLQQENRNLRVELALGNAARAHGADESLLTAVLAHKGEIAKLDPSSPTFTNELDAVVKAEVEANPKLKSVQAAPVSGVPTPAGPGAGADIDAQIKAAEEAGDIARAIRLKRHKAYSSS